MKLSWREKEPTTIQRTAISNMQTALGMKQELPVTRGGCSDLIGKLKSTIEANVQINGTVRFSGPVGYSDDEDEDPFEYMEQF